MRLFLCEKPSQARDIAKVLGANRRAEGCLMGPEVTVTWCVGHLLEAAPPQAYDPCYQHWTLAHLPIIPQRWKVEVKPKTAAQFKVIKRLLAAAEALVIATDADREGELIAWEILELCAYRGPVQRLWLSALNEASIRKALGALRPGAQTFALYQAALARSRADWLVGMNLSRLFTLLGRRSGYEGVLSVGRVQTPTLRLVVDRDRAIARFVPTPYWQVEVRLNAQGRTFSAQWLAPEASLDPQGHCTDASLAQQVTQQLQAHHSAPVQRVTCEQMQEAAPLPFDLSTLQELCARQLGLGVHTTLEIAQSLYETHKATSYPRTDCRYLPDSQFEDVPLVLAALLQSDPDLAPILSSLDPSRRSRAWNEAKLTAHHGIVPTAEPVQLARMSETERAVYRLIRNHYLAQFLPEHQWQRTQVDLECAGQRLRAVGKRTLQQGWLIVLPHPHEDPPDQLEQLLPQLQQGADCMIKAVERKSLRTQAPKPLTEGTLLKAMKNVAQQISDPRLKRILRATTGIGTEATRASIIKGLIDRGYLLKKRNALRASQAGHTLIEAVPTSIADPGTTAVWEQALDEIAAGRMSLEHFLLQQAAWITRLIEQASTLNPSSSNESGPHRSL